MVNFIYFPIFDGVSCDLRQWIAWLEDFFVRERFTEDEKMNLAQSLLEGEANAWFYSSRSVQSWEHLVVELLIWRFGDFGDGGVFSDLELFLLWNKHDRILRKRRKRMTTTSIPEKNLNLTASRETTDSTLATKSIQEAISESVLDGDASIEKDESYEATMVKVEDDTTMFQGSDSLEEESIHQNQVQVASVEPSLRFSSESLVVSEARPSEIMSNNRVHSQSVLDCVKNTTNAYQVFDKTSSHKESRKPKTKRKLRLSLKTWMFKFKHTSKRSKSLDVKFLSVEEISWLTKDSKEIYRSCVDNEFEEVLAGCGKKLFDRFQTSPSDAFAVVNKTSKPWETHTPFTSTQVASVNSLSFEVGTEENLFSGLSQTNQVWEPGGVLVDWFVDFNGYDGIVDGIRCLAIDSRRASHVWERGGLDIRTDHGGLLVFPWHLMLLEFFLFFYFGRQAVLDQITKGLEMKQKMKVLKSWMFKYKPATSSSMLPLYVNQMGASDIQDNDKEMVADPVKQAVLNLITNAARFGLVSVLIWLTVWRVLYLLGTLFWSTSFKKQKFGKNWWYKFKQSLWPRAWGRELLGVEILVAEAVVKVKFDDVGRRELLIEWHDHDASETSWMFFKAFVHLYFSFKLEDKLGLQGVSIDTIHQSYHGKKKQVPAQQGLIEEAGDVAEASAQCEDSGCERSFAVESRKFI